MNDSSQIRFLVNNEIDRTKWDSCIERSGNGLIYARSFYLDCFAKSWNALVLNDYKAVMPLPSRKKWGIDYLFQPFITPVLGVFGNDASEEIISRFLDAIPSKYKLWDISLNPSNTVNKKFQKLYRRGNYILSLSSPYNEIRGNYSENILRNISKAARSGCILKKGVDIRDIIHICKDEWPGFTNIEEGIFDSIVDDIDSFKPYLETYGVYHADFGLIASCAFLVDDKRAYYWLVGNRPIAKELGASPLLIDKFIQDHAGGGKILDFEGSDVKTIAEFYQRFGAIAENYTTIYRNRLPFPLNFIKGTPSHYRNL